MITHDLGVVAGMADRVAVMYAGKVVETGTLREIYYQSRHPYTWGLLNSVPRIDAENKAELVPIHGTPPDLFAPPPGCAFAARCKYAMEVCLEEQPMETTLTETHRLSCWLCHPMAPEVARPVLGGNL